MMGMIAREKQEISTAWKIAIFGALVFMIVTTIQDMKQSKKLTDLEHRIDILTLKLEQQQKEGER
jgi:nicotinic acid mononucleotide adenylyltransferase